MNRIGIGFVSGGVGSLFSVPSEVALVRMASASRQCGQRHYKNVFDCFARIAKEAALWRGARPTMARACLFHAGQLAVYPEAKKSIHKTTSLTGIPLQLGSSLVSGVAAVALSCPVDVLKTRIQNSLARGQYAGMKDCLHKTVATEGVRALWKGSIPSLVRMAPQSMISFLVLENVFSWYSGNKAS